MNVVFKLRIAVQSMTGEWSVWIHERGHFVHNSPYNFGSTQTYTTMFTLSGNKTRKTIHEIHRQEVNYLNDSKTPCQFVLREEDMNTCIQHHIEKEMRCELSWHSGMGALPKCASSDQYKHFIRAYDKIVSLSPTSISKETGCLPSCKRNEYKVKVINRGDYPNEYGHTMFMGYFYIPSGRYIKKDYYYTYGFDSYIADVGGLIGLFLGHSLLSIYDFLKQGWKNKNKCR